MGSEGCPGGSWRDITLLHSTFQDIIITLLTVALTTTSLTADQISDIGPELGSRCLLSL